MKDKYASEIALTTLQEMKSILNSMDKAIYTQLKVICNESWFENADKFENKITQVIKKTLNQHFWFQAYAEEPRSKKNKKIIVGTVGGVMIALLGVLFVRSLKQLKWKKYIWLADQSTSGKKILCT